jgi:hypothetical protein
MNKLFILFIIVLVGCKMETKYQYHDRVRFESSFYGTCEMEISEANNNESPFFISYYGWTDCSTGSGGWMTVEEKYAVKVNKKDRKP